MKRGWKRCEVGGEGGKVGREGCGGVEGEMGLNKLKTTTLLLDMSLHSSMQTCSLSTSLKSKREPREERLRPKRTRKSDSE